MVTLELLFLVELSFACAHAEAENGVSTCVSFLRIAPVVLAVAWLGDIQLPVSYLLV